MKATIEGNVLQLEYNGRAWMLGQDQLYGSLEDFTAFINRSGTVQATATSSSDVLKISHQHSCWFIQENATGGTLERFAQFINMSEQDDKNIDWTYSAKDGIERIDHKDGSAMWLDGPTVYDKWYSDQVLPLTLVPYERGYGHKLAIFHAIKATCKTVKPIKPDTTKLESPPFNPSQQQTLARLADDIMKNAKDGEQLLYTKPSETEALQRIIAPCTQGTQWIYSRSLNRVWSVTTKRYIEIDPTSGYATINLVGGTLGKHTESAEYPDVVQLFETLKSVAKTVD